MTTQEAYERIRAHFNRPEAVLAKEEIDGISRCVYRGGGDAKSPIRCAFGVLIPDSKYTPDMEDKFAGAVCDQWPKVMEVVSDVRPQFIEEAQYLHDSRAHDARDFVRQLDEIAQEYELTVPA